MGTEYTAAANSSERAKSLAQGNALCRSKRIHTKPQRGVIRLFDCAVRRAVDCALTGLSGQSAVTAPQGRIKLVLTF